MDSSNHNHQHAPNRFGVIPTTVRLNANPEYTGKGVTIAFLDSGFYPHPDLVTPVNRVIAYEDLIDELEAAGIDVLLDDRDERPGVMFADLELVGIPHRITIGDRGLKQGQVEYVSRRDGKPQMIEAAGALAFAKKAVQ